MWKIVFGLTAASALVIGLTANTLAQGPFGERRGAGPPNSAAIIAGQLTCQEFNGELYIQLNTNGIIGVPGSNFYHVFSREGTCAEALALLPGELPTPLCTSEVDSFSFGEGFLFVCSGPANDVIHGVGELAKAFTRGI